MSGARNFIFYSTVLGLFASNFYWPGNTSLQLFFLIMAINLFLMLLMKRLWIPGGILALFTILATSAAIGILRDTDTLIKSSKEVIGIVGSAAYFCCFFRAIDFDLVRAFKAYARVCYWIAILGFILLPFQIYFFQLMRLQSILSEPAMIAFTCLPALYYYAEKWRRERTHGKDLLVIGAALLASQSSTGYLGILFGAFLVLLEYRRFKFVVPIIVLLLAYGIYSVSDFFALRVNDTINTFATSDVKGTNLSTFVLYTNGFVMERVLASHPFLGNGIGSHGESFKTYIDQLSIDDYEEGKAEFTNYEDASSMGIRTLSDMGISGALLIVWFIWRFRPNSNTDDLDIIARAIWVYFFMKIIRGGTYFEDEQYFFVVIYALNHYARAWRAKHTKQTHTPTSSIPLVTRPALLPL